MRTLFRTLALVVLCALLSGWGREGHQVISSNAVFSFSTDGSQFLVWSDYLVDHSSDADNRRSSDPDESPRHFIDIDNYPEFVATGKISVSYSENVAKHGQEFVIKQGTLPWATLATYDSLKRCFTRRDWDKAAFFAADLGHYVADGFMPLHLAANYDGQLTGNKGIHARYESGMIAKYKDDIKSGVKPVIKISDPESFIFSYLYRNFKYVDSIIAADNYATKKAGNNNSALYKQFLWEKTEGFTQQLFAGASEAFASLLYSAWLEAGKPAMPSSGLSHQDSALAGEFNVAYNGVFKSSATINYSVPAKTKVNISVYSPSGNLSEVLDDETKPQGEYSLKWNPGKNSRGVWFIIYRTEKDFLVKKIIL